MSQTFFNFSSVDATITETKVPANCKPNFIVGEGENFVPVNGRMS